MKTIQLLCCFIIFSSIFGKYSRGNNNSTDSSDRRFINLMIEKIQKENPNRNLDTALVNVLLTRSRKINYIEGEAMIAYFKSISLIKNQKFEEAENLISPFIEIKNNKILDTIKPYLCIKISEAGIHSGKYFTSLKYLETLSELSKIPAKVVLASYAQNAFIWSALPEHYQPEGYKKSLYYCHLAETLAKTQSNFYNLGLMLNNSGNMYIKLKEWDSAANKINDALAFGQQHNLPQIIQSSYFNLAQLFYEQGLYNKALDANEKGMEFQDHNPISTLANLKLQNIEILLKLGKAAHLKKRIAALSIDLGTKNTMHDVQIYDIRYKYYTAVGDYKSSFENYKKMTELRDSISGSTLLQEANYLDYKYKIIEKDKSILEAQLLLNKKSSQIKQQRSWLLGSISIAAIIALGASVIYLRQTNKQKLIEKENEVSKMQSFLDGEFKERERIAMDLHDSLGGLVSSIRLKFEMAMLEKFNDQQEINKINNLIVDAAQSLRVITHNLNPPELFYSDLSTAIKQYCTTISSGTDLKINIKVPENLNINKPVSTELLATLKELIHNIVKHANASLATITISQEKTGIVMTVTDNGKGFDTTTTDMKGIGIANVKNRIAKLNGHVEIRSNTGKGTSVIIEINT